MVQGTARGMEELESIDDCVEEIVFLFMDAFTCTAGTPATKERRRFDLPDRVREVLLRAREVPLRPADLDSSPQSGWPAQPA